MGTSTTKRPGKRDLLGQSGALGPDRVLRHLAEDGLAGTQQLLDPGLARGSPGLDVVGVVADVAAVEDGVLRGADVDERRLHARAARSAPGRGRCCRRSGWRRRGPRDVVLHQGAALEQGDLGHRRGARGRRSCSARPPCPAARVRPVGPSAWDRHRAVPLGPIPASPAGPGRPPSSRQTPWWPSRCHRSRSRAPPLVPGRRPLIASAPRGAGSGLIAGDPGRVSPIFGRGMAGRVPPDPRRPHRRHGPDRLSSPAPARPARTSRRRRCGSVMPAGATAVGSAPSLPPGPPRLRTGTAAAAPLRPRPRPPRDPRRCRSVRPRLTTGPRTVGSPRPLRPAG